MDQEQSINKRVSIVIPVYNSHKTLPKCLDSMIAQTYQDLEIICVNDCSKDNSLGIIKEYQKKDPRVKLVNHSENLNAGGARNSGIKAATGTYVCFVDNDDWMTPDAIEILIQNSERCSIDIVAPDWCEWYSEKETIEHSNFLENVSKEENCNHSLIYGCRILGCLIRKSIFTDNNLFYPERTFWEDNAIGIPLLFCANRIRAVKRILYFYYISPGSSSRSYNLKKTSDRIKTTHLMYENFKRLDLITVRNSALIDYKILCLSYFSIRMLAINYSSDASRLLNKVSDDISSLLPNNVLKQYHPNYVLTLKFPILSYRLWAIMYWIKNKVS